MNYEFDVERWQLLGLIQALNSGSVRLEQRHERWKESHEKVLIEEKEEGKE